MAVTSALWWQRCVRGMGLVSGLCVVAWGLAGCVATTPGVGADSAVLSQSEETESRRRARIRLELAANYFESGQTTVALDEVKQALVTDSSYADAHNLLGLIQMRLNDYPQAHESFRRALNLRPSDANIQHNQAWLWCLEKKYAEADQAFTQVLLNPNYLARSKTLMAQGLCQLQAGQNEVAEKTLLRSYELDAGNPVVGYHLSALLFLRGELSRARFYIRRLNNSELSNAETLWLGIKVEAALGDSVAMRQLADQLRKRFPDSREQSLYEKGSFDE